jgi:chromosome segregation ATPase
MNKISEYINDLLSIQGLDLAKDVFNHNDLSNFLIECRDEIEQLQSQYDIAIGAIRVGVERIEQLTSGSGGIMEMKQTIADKEAEIADKERRLENVHKAYEKLGQMYNDLADKCQNAENEKVLLDWPENYGQGSEPWLNKE